MLRSIPCRPLTNYDNNANKMYSKLVDLRDNNLLCNMYLSNRYFSVCIFMHFAHSDVVRIFCLFISSLLGNDDRKHE